MAPPPVTGAGNRRALAGILFLAAAGEAYQAYGSINSSPQTTELFAGEREKTLMKYVRIGDWTAIVLAALASLLSRSVWPIIGAALVVVQMHWLYVYAARCGKRDQQPPSSPSPAARYHRYREDT